MRTFMKPIRDLFAPRASTSKASDIVLALTIHKERDSSDSSEFLVHTITPTEIQRPNRPRIGLKTRYTFRGIFRKTEAGRDVVCLHAHIETMSLGYKLFRAGGPFEGILHRYEGGAEKQYFVKATPSPSYRLLCARFPLESPENPVVVLASSH